MDVDEMVELLKAGLETSCEGEELAARFRAVDLAGPNAIRAITQTGDVFLIRVQQEE
jgi:hypothetical protein